MTFEAIRRSADLREHLAGAAHFQLKLAQTLLTIEGLELLHDALHADDRERPRLEIDEFKAEASTRMALEDAEAEVARLRESLP